MGKRLDAIIEKKKKEILYNLNSNSNDGVELHLINNLLDDVLFIFAESFKNEVFHHYSEYYPALYEREGKLLNYVGSGIELYYKLKKHSLNEIKNGKVYFKFNLSHVRESMYKNTFNHKGDVIGLWDKGWHAKRLESNNKGRRFYTYNNVNNNDISQWVTNAMYETKRQIKMRYKVDIDISYMSAYDMQH